jgi:hypothetical protein
VLQRSSRQDVPARAIWQPRRNRPHVGRNTPILLPPDLRDWLPAAHPSSPCELRRNMLGSIFVGTGPLKKSGCPSPTGCHRPVRKATTRLIQRRPRATFAARVQIKHFAPCRLLRGSAGSQSPTPLAIRQHYPLGGPALSLRSRRQMVLPLQNLPGLRRKDADSAPTGTWNEDRDRLPELCRPLARFAAIREFEKGHPWRRRHDPATLAFRHHGVTTPGHRFGLHTSPTLFYVVSVL